MTNKNNKATQPLGLKQRLKGAPREERREILDGLPHKVGFGKPPKSYRFKPGRSGNPRGRPRGTPNIRTLLIEELSQPVEVREGNRRRKLSKAQVVVRQCANQAAGGNLRAFQVLGDLMRRAGLMDADEAPAEREPVLTPEDLRTAESLMKEFATAEASEESEGGRDDD